MGTRYNLSALAGVAAMATMLLAATVHAKELKYITFKPQTANDAQSITVQWFVDQFNQRVAGKHTMKVFWGGSVAGIREVPDALETGVGDIGDVVAPYFQDQLLVNNIVSLFMPQPRSEIELGQKLMQWYEQYPQFDAEMKKYNMKIVGWRPLEKYGLICTKPLRTAADLKGLRVRTYGHALPRLFEALGATPVSMSTPETYEALERKILDCSPIGVTLARGWRLEEVAKYFVELPLGANWGHFIAVNRKSYDALDEQTRSILDGLGREYLVHYVNTLAVLTEKILQEWKTSGVQVLPFPSAPVAQAVRSEGVQKVRQAWIERAGKTGLPAAELTRYFSFE